MHLNVLFLFLLRWACLASAGDTAGLPILEVELSPPKEFMPQVEAVIASEEKDSVSMEQAQLDNLEQAYQVAVASARKKIESLVRNNLRPPGFRKDSFLSLRSTSAKNARSEFDVRLTIDPASESDKGWDTAIQQIAKKGYKEEHAFFDAVEKDFAMLEKAVLIMLQDNLQKKSPIFLQLKTLSGKANVRVKPSSAGWPRLADLVSNWRDVHDVRWRSIRGKVIEIQSRYLAALNKIIDESLRKYGSP